MGVMSGKGVEVVEIMGRRRMEVLCIQKTKWKEYRARTMMGGYKLKYTARRRRWKNNNDLALPSYVEGKVELSDITDTEMQTGMKGMKKGRHLVSMRCVWRW